MEKAVYRMSVGVTIAWYTKNGAVRSPQSLTQCSIFVLERRREWFGKDTAATILHADLDAFYYASVEQLRDPSMRGKPIAVGGGVVLAASYEAKAFGVSGGMTGWWARELCPHLIFVDGHFKEYQRLGDAAIGVLHDFTPLVERISIDEAFADVAGCTHLFGPPAAIARAVRHRVRTELGLPISIGIACTRHLAKIASWRKRTFSQCPKAGAGVDPASPGLAAIKLPDHDGGRQETEQGWNVPDE